MKKTYLCFFSMLLLAISCATPKQEIILLNRENVPVPESIGIHIIFPEMSNTSVGTVQIIRDSERMNIQSFEQAVIFSTKLKKNFSIFRLANVDREESGEYAMFLVNTIGDMDIRDFYLENLKSVHDVNFAGYNIAFFTAPTLTLPLIKTIIDVPDIDFIFTDSDSLNLLEYEVIDFDFEEIIPDFDNQTIQTTWEDLNVNISNFVGELRVHPPFTRVEGHFVKATTYASSSRLDEALDRAFELALTEISKHQIQQVISTSVAAEHFLETATVIEAENIVDNLMFSEIKLSLNFHFNIHSFVAQVELKKDLRKNSIEDYIPDIVIQDEDDDYAEMLYIYPPRDDEFLLEINSEQSNMSENEEYEESEIILEHQPTLMLMERTIFRVVEDHDNNSE
ncbi:MAG: hypothetical protein FWG98_11020 [Candidatus Cloacimonetes bacterium]|nr:hypothetical protein [Candidatus Cloacimonadota bacterium]